MFLLYDLQYKYLYLVLEAKLDIQNVSLRVENLNQFSMLYDTYCRIWVFLAHGFTNI